MKVRLLKPAEDFDWDAEPPWNADALTADLALDTLFEAMAQGDKRILDAARKVVLAGVAGDVETILYRQGVLRDCLANPAAVRELYDLAVESVEQRRKYYLGTLARYPHWVLNDALDQMGALMGFAGRLKSIANSRASAFRSGGWTEFFAMLHRELDEPFFARVRAQLKKLRFRDAIAMSARLAPGNRPDRYVLHDMLRRRWPWWRQALERCRAVFVAPKLPPNSFEIDPRDEAGARALERLNERGIAGVADVVAQSKDHVRNFFVTLATELAFYVGCINLREALARKGEPVCMPQPCPAADGGFAFAGLYDVCLTLRIDARAVGNAANADGKALVIVTGANQGGKSTFLRSVGLAQLMMQAGMFAAADSFKASVCHGLFTHYKREEDSGMESGKFDEELRRMSDIVDRIAPRATILFNESFAATNEREGSEIARQVVTALLESSIRVFYVTHLYELARGVTDGGAGNVLSLRAERREDGTRTFKLIAADPLRTSFGEDLYRDIFGAEAAQGGRAKTTTGVS